MRYFFGTICLTVTASLAISSSAAARQGNGGQTNGGEEWYCWQCFDNGSTLPINYWECITSGSENWDEYQIPGEDCWTEPHLGDWLCWAIPECEEPSLADEHLARPLPDGRYWYLAARPQAGKDCQGRIVAVAGVTNHGGEGSFQRVHVGGTTPSVISF